MTRWDSFSTLAASLTLEDISDPSSQDTEHETPVLRVVAEARSKEYDVVCMPLTTDAWKERWSNMCLLPNEATEEEKETAARAAETWRLRPGFLKDEVVITRLVRNDAEIVCLSTTSRYRPDGVWQALQQELAYAGYLNINTAILPPPRNRNIRHPMRGAIQSWSQTLLQSPQTPALGDPCQRLTVKALKILNVAQCNLEMWDLIRSMSWDLSPALPTSLGVLNNGLPESVRHIFLPASTYPVLPKPTQAFLRNSHDCTFLSCMLPSTQHRPTIILADANTGKHARGGERAYAQYIRHLETTSPIPGTVENFAQGYQDYLQAPLQPLMDNLPSFTYQTFERDPVKYAQYEEAMYRAFVDRPAGEKSTRLTCVAGAGRGPLVSRCLKGLGNKNQNAYVTRRSGGDKVKLVFGDMRLIDVPEKVDILVSELPCPECLDGAMRFLKDGGISIPSSYTAHLAPLSSSKLYNEARTGNTLTVRCGPQVQECWEFEHPRAEAILDARGKRLLAVIPGVLYGIVGLSIHPHNARIKISKDMLSWFPALLSVQKLLVSIWRLTNDKQVWYEWHAESFWSLIMSSELEYESVKIGHTSLHNPGGRSSWIGL
ncbi:shk1 kinase-binding protein 1 [Coprinopsis sp. MPI-PUGE-AT-0042]|nr:shk1 kinase-binding protein 1 [Coprinopsis sp. MPI-PUGE-AT-0042]